MGKGFGGEGRWCKDCGGVNEKRGLRACWIVVGLNRAGEMKVYEAAEELSGMGMLKMWRIV